MFPRRGSKKNTTETGWPGGRRSPVPHHAPANQDVFPHSTSDPHRNRWIMSGAGTEGKKPRLAEHEVEHIVSIMEMVRV
jgi:hypothetical protein